MENQDQIIKNLREEISKLRNENDQLSAAVHQFLPHSSVNIAPMVLPYQILDNMALEVTVYDAEKRYVYLNPAAVSNVSARKMLIGKTDVDYCQALNRPLIIAENRMLLFDSSVYDREQKEWEEEWQKEDGSTEFYLRRIFPVFDNHGQLVMMIGYGMNISQRVWAENGLRTSEELYRTLVQEAKDYGIFMLDVSGNIISWNEGAHRITGYNTREIMGQHLSVFYRAGKVDTHGNELSIAEQTGKFEEEGWRVKKDGNEFWASVIITPLYNYRHQLVGFSNIIHDLTERKQAEELLKDAMKKAESSSKAKQLFLMNMSHEIRTPMNAIIGLSSLLGRENLDAKQQRYLNAITVSARNLHSIINDILDFSKIDAGQLSVTAKPFKPLELVLQQVSILEFQAEEKGIDINLDLDTGLYPVLISDPVRINQILLNLLGNAMKFTEKGSIDISLKVLRDSDNSQKLQFEIRDTGIGIPEEKLPFIFDMFYQVNDSEIEKYRGTGLGLTITKQLVELLGGEVFVESRRNEGTRIGFTVELKKASEADEAQPSATVSHPALLKGKSILLVEDNEINRMLAVAVLESWGIKVDVAVNGKLGIEKLEHTAYDLVLMDIRMPEMNGIQAIKHIREKMRLETPVIAMTANVINGDARECLQAGMNDYVSKPFDESELFFKICFYLNIPAGNAQWHPPESNAEVSQKKLYNKERLIKIGKGNEEFVNHMLTVFVDQANQACEQIGIAWEQRNLSEIRDIAHKVSASIASICDARLVNLVYAIEEQSENEAEEGLKELIEEFNKEIYAVIHQILEDRK